MFSSDQYKAIYIAYVEFKLSPKEIAYYLEYSLSYIYYVLKKLGIEIQLKPRINCLHCGDPAPRSDYKNFCSHECRILSGTYKPGAF